jgi:hypothetical protein
MTRDYRLRGCMHIIQECSCTVQALLIDIG